MFFDDLELIPGSCADPPDLVAGAAARNHPSRRAGGQDDMSSKQTPSNYIVLYYTVDGRND